MTDVPNPAGWLVDEGFMLTDPQDKYAVPLYAHPPANDSLVHAEIVSIGDKILDVQVRQAQRIKDLEAALRPFAAIAEKIEQYWKPMGDSTRVFSVGDAGMTIADLKRAKQLIENGGSE